MVTDQYFRRQHGVISRAQALDAGLSLDQIRYRVRRQQSWIEVHPGVYHLAAVLRTWHSALMALVLYTGGVASHRTGSALWHLELYRAPRILEVTVPFDNYIRQPDAALIHRTKQWALADIVERNGIPCTGIDRTILDCGAVLGPPTVERLAESAIRQKLTSWPQLAVTLSRHSRKGRDGCGVLRTVLDERLANATVPLSDFSRVVANLLVDSGLPRPTLEHPILDEHGRIVMLADLAWPHLQKAWELDGLAYHFAREAVERDRRKRNKAKALGWNIQEILWSMYAKEPEQLVALARRFLTPTPVLSA